jgi:hypothetical protein
LKEFVHKVCCSVCAICCSNENAKDTVVPTTVRASSLFSSFSFTSLLEDNNNEEEENDEKEEVKTLDSCVLRRTKSCTVRSIDRDSIEQKTSDCRTSISSDVLLFFHGN